MMNILIWARTYVTYVTHVGRGPYDDVPRVLGKVTDAAQLQMTNYISDVVISECKQIPGLDIHGKGV